MDEIVFEFRNKNYGAYLLRRYYNRHLTISLLIAVFLLCAGLSYPFISSFSYKNIGRYITHSVVIDLSKRLPTEKVAPPPLPPPAIDILKNVFHPPVVIEGDVPESDLLNQDYLNKTTINGTIKTEESGTAAIDPPVLEIKPEAEVFYSVQEMPSFVGGESAMYKFIADNITYPRMAKENNVQGKVYISFVVDGSGHIINVKLLRGIGSGCDEEAIRVISMMPAWNAGRQNGRSVSVLYNMPIVFKLEN